MNVSVTPLQGVAVVETVFHRDERGSFGRLFCANELADIVGLRKIVQINCSTTRQVGAIRGLHFQRPPHAEMKFVRCLRGTVWDVAVDLRRDSSTFLKWYAEELDADNARMMIIPEGCAHGFQTLAGDCELLYLHTASYAQNSESGVAWDDPRLAISWPLPIPANGGLSDRDRRLPALSPNFEGLDA